MEVSASWRIRFSEMEFKEIVAKHVNDMGEYFVYPDDVTIVSVGGKFEVIILGARGV